jgi:hypothetical protein
MLMIHDNEGEEAVLPEDELNAVMVAHSALAPRSSSSPYFSSGVAGRSMPAIA